ncbi:MAG: hypothetical protein COA90_06720 [Gammaproteobacteria bacterium]|nr:MAG: hypothetical protein COA90_06720 [Gammaproteobacteria bacterium]
MELFDLQWQYPRILYVLPLMLLPWFTRVNTRLVVWNYFIPDDPLSKIISILLKSLASLVFICLTLSLASPYIAEQMIERVGTGAEVIILVDRSRSMDDPFSSRDKAVAASRTVGRANSKRRIANKYLLEFVDLRPDDRFGFILFSNKALDLLPLSYNKNTLRATIKASSLGKGLSETNIAAALIKAAEMYSSESYRGSRMVLLVSDGGQEFSAEDKQTISQLYKHEQLTLYWIYMGAISGLAQDDNKLTKGEPWQNKPEKKLHRFFKSLAIPYRVFETGSAKEFSASLITIDKRENNTLIVKEVIPRESKAALFLWLAFIATLLLLIVQFYTVLGVRNK